MCPNNTSTDVLLPLCKWTCIYIPISWSVPWDSCMMKIQRLSYLILARAPEQEHCCYNGWNTYFYIHQHFTLRRRTQRVRHTIEFLWLVTYSHWTRGGCTRVSAIFCGMQFKLSHSIGNVLFLLTQRVELGWGGVHWSLWQNVFN